LTGLLFYATIPKLGLQLNNSERDENQGALLSGLLAGGNVGSIGCAVPLLVLIGILVGRQLDRWLGTSPLLLLAMLLISILAGVGLMLSSAYAAARMAQQQVSSRQQPGSGSPDHPRNANGGENI
jgi:hypothetical protein